MHSTNDNKSNNSIVNFNQTKFSMEELDAHLKEGQKHLPKVASSVLPYMKMARDGDFLYGQENIPAEEGARWVINIATMEKGWVAWHNSKKLPGERMGLLNNPPSQPDIDYSHLGAQWQEQFSFQLKCLDGDDEGQEVLFITSSMGGKRAFNAVHDAGQNRPDRNYWQPVVLLESSSYDNKNFGTTVFEPQFTIIDWADNEQRLLNDDGNVISIENAPEADGMQSEPAPDVDVKRKQRKQRSSAA